MKFAEYLNENLVPEWKDKYLNYKAGKKKIKQITGSSVLRRTLTSATPNNINSAFLSSINFKGKNRSQESFSELPPAALKVETPEIATTSEPSRSAPSVDDRTPLLQSGQRADSGSKNSQFEPHDPSNREGEPRVTRRLTSRGTNNINPQSYGGGSVSLTAGEPLKSFNDTEANEFTEWLDLELDKISNFYKENENQALERFLLLQDQLYHLRVEKLKMKAKTERAELIKKSLNKTTYKFNRYELPSLPDFNFGRSKASNDSDRSRDYEHQKHDIPYYIARRQLKAAVQEFYRGLELLKNYRMLNRTAFRKLVKKYDKRTNSTLSDTYMEKVNSSYFATSDVLDNLIPKIEDLFSANFENGNRKIAIEKLRSNLKDEVFYTSTFLAGLFYGLAVPLFIYAVYLGVKSLEDSVSEEAKFILQIWSGFFLMILMAFLFGIDCYIWSKFKVNYKFIFEFNQRNCLNSKQVHLLPSLFFFALSLIAWFGFNDFWPDNVPSRDWPWFFLGFSFLVFFLPFNILYLESRKWLIITVWRLFFSGFYPVEFKDFFLGDIFSSLTYATGNISFFFCVYATHWKDAASGDPTCGSSRSRAMGFFATLPSIWRFLQCLRRYSDSGDWFPHLANMAKYGVSIGYYVMLSVYRIDRSESNRGIFILIATVNSIYCTIWDILMDWSLMQDSTFLRKNLTFPRWTYYSAVVANTLLRFQWVFYALFAQYIQQSAMTSFFVSVAEITRRFIWMLLRMENEHIANITSYRASREVRLPYETTIRDEASVISRTPSYAHFRTADDQEATVGLGVSESAQASASGYQSSSVKRRKSILSSGVFQNVSKAIVNAHKKDFQRRKPDSHEGELATNSSDDENSDDDHVSVIRGDP